MDATLKEEFSSEVRPVGLKPESRNRPQRDNLARGTKNKRDRGEFSASSTCSVDDDFDDEDDDEDGDEKERAVNLLTKLLTKSSGRSMSNNKPLSEFTDTDFERESKELKIKIDRLKCKELEQKTRFYSEFSSGMPVVVAACRSFLDEKKRNASGLRVMPSSLNGAYEESLNGDPRFKI